MNEVSERGAVLDVSVRAKLSSSFTLNVQCALGPGVTVIFGPSGSGKTTLLNCLAGFVRPEEGQITLNGKVLFDATARVNLPTQQRRVGYVFQQLALFPHLTAAANVEYGLAGLRRDERQRRSEALLASFRIAHLRDRKPDEISGGERQRVALARALVLEPEALLLDEPLAALDIPTRGLILDDLRHWSSARPIPILYVTHSRDEVFALAHRVLVFEKGTVIAEGTPQQVLDAPAREWTALAAGFENLFDVVVSAQHQAEGTMTCRIGGTETTLEAPVTRARVGERLRIGVRAGDILLASCKPVGLSARNVLQARVLKIENRGATAHVYVDCGVALEAHLTPAACQNLELTAGREVWAVIKTHSCHLFQPD
jgi:molybdate transport system ATP-binding protein